MGATLKDLRQSPEEVKDGIGYALELVQSGGKPATAKPLKGFRGASVLEIVEDHVGSTWRAVYTVEFASAIYVLHFFSEEVEDGYRDAATPHRSHQAPSARGAGICETRTRMTTKITKSSGNVFADLGLKNPEEHALKAELVRQIAGMLDKEGLTQTEAARRLRIAQPDVSRMLRGHFRQFSVERLMRFLVALGQDVEIVVRPSPTARSKGARLTVTTQA